MNWPEVEFEELYSEPSRNGVYKPKDQHGEGAKIVNMGELFGHDIIANQEMKRLKMSDAEMAKSGLADGDLLFGRRSLVEAGAGKSSLVEGLDEPTTFESSIIRVRLDKSKADPRFYYYWLKSPIGRGRIAAIVSGTNVKGIRSSDLKQIKVVRPPLGIQEKVVRSIRPYDDLIENNRRRIAFLEEAARLLYREWFVHLRFPGHENAKIIDGVPEGWQKSPLFDFAKPTYGFAFKSDMFNDNAYGTPVVRIRDVPNRQSGTWTAEEAPREKLLSNGDFLIGMDGDFHMNFWAGGPAWLNQRVVKLDGKNGVSTGFLRVSVEQQILDLNETITGTTVKHLGAKHLKNVAILIPNDDLLEDMNETMDNIRHQIVTLAVQMQYLSKARDLMLPRLMDGRIEV